MFTVFWIMLLFSLRSSNTYTVASALGTTVCEMGFCITLNEGVITAEAGLCVVIPCSFNTTGRFTPKTTVWFKCESQKKRCGDSDKIFHTNRNKTLSKYLGRVFLLNPDVSQGNCSLMINDLTTLESGSYKLRFNGEAEGVTFTPRTTVFVKDLYQKPTVINPPLTEGQQATLTCTPPGLCSGSPPNITWMWSRKREAESNITGNMTASFKTENLTAVTQRHSSTLTFNPSAAHHNTNITCKVSFKGGISTEETVTLKVNYKRKPHITGNTTVKEGEALNLTCTVESFPQSLVVWTKHSASGIYLQIDTGSATLAMSNVTAGDSGQYVCTVTHLGETVTVYADVKLTWFSKILNNSGCVLQSEIMTCVCITEGFPLPTITWPLLKDHTEYSVLKTVSNYTVNTTVTIPLKNHQYTSVECFSSHENGEAKENLTVRRDFSEKEAIQSKTIIEKVAWLEFIVAFLIGVLLTSVICCMVIKCNRKTVKNSGNVEETLNMISEEDSKINDGQTVQNLKIHVQEEAENGAVAAEKSVSEVSNDSKDVQYANIDFRNIKRRGAREVAKERESTLTEYAEIRTETKEQRKHSIKEANDILEDNEEDLMSKHDEEMKDCVSEVQEEVVAVYSTVTYVLDEI